MSYFDKKIFFLNPIFIYLKWLFVKIKYQTKYWGAHLRIGYNAHVDSCIFSEYNNVGSNVSLYKCTVGKFTYFADNSLIMHSNIGSFCSIGPNVKIAPGRHPTSKYVSTHPITFSNCNFINYSFNARNTFEEYKTVNIGNDVWIGANAVIVDGVTIEDGAIIGANSVVTKDVKAYDIVGGIPAKVIRRRFTDEQIKFLIEIKWWDKSNEWIGKNILLFESVDDFISNIYLQNKDIQNPK